MESNISLEIGQEQPMPLAMRFLEEIDFAKGSSYGDVQTYFGVTGLKVGDFGSD